MNNQTITLLMLIKTASLENKNAFLITFKKSILKLLPVLYKQGIIQNFSVVTILNKQKILINLRYSFNKPICKNIKLLSKPSLYLHLTFTDICLLCDKRHLLFLSTKKGILTSLECKIYGTGGTALFLC